MKYVKLTVNGVTYNLIQTVNDVWTITNRAPMTSGEYLMTVTVTTDSGQEIELSADDPELAAALTLIVKEGSTVIGSQMLEYYPPVLQMLRELQAVVKIEGFELDFLNSELTFVLNDAYLLTMGEDRISQWEKLLKITPIEGSSIEDRRSTIIARIRGQGKLNTKLISLIVNAFTGGTATSHIENSTLYVEIKPPAGNRSYQFSSVENELKSKTPAHLGLVVKRDYATWGDIRSNFTSWEAIANKNTWEDLVLYIAPT